MAADPDLSEAGRARAASLATALKDAGIAAIFTTEFKRTQQTAEPLAKALGLTVNGRRRRTPRRRWSNRLPPPGNVLVVGHSNTVPAVVKGLGVTTAVAIGDDEFDNLFVVTRGGAPSLLRPALSMMRVLDALDADSRLSLRRWLLASPSSRPSASTGAQSSRRRSSARIWDAEHVSPPLPPLLDHAEVVKRLEAVVAGDAGSVHASRRSASRSRAARSTYVQRGHGSVSRDALVADARRRADRDRGAVRRLRVPAPPPRTTRSVRGILSSLTLYVVPMLNPDGAERFQRRNAQSIDINRDALRLQTPEGQRAEGACAIASSRASASTCTTRAGARRSAIRRSRRRSRCCRSPSTKPRSENAGPQAHEEDLRGHPRRARAVRVGSDRPLRRRVRGARVRRQHHAVGHAGGADRDRPVAVGGAGPGARPPELRRHPRRRSTRWRPATVDRADPQRYESLPINESGVLYVLVRNATVISGAGVPPFIADIGIVANRRVRDVDGRRELQMVADHRRHGRSADAGRAAHDRRAPA